MISMQEFIEQSLYMGLKDNMLHRINDLVHLTFVYQELEDKDCLDNGRNAYQFNSKNMELNRNFLYLFSRKKTTDFPWPLENTGIFYSCFPIFSCLIKQMAVHFYISWSLVFDLITFEISFFHIDIEQ
jgi:hypothetical protein